MQKRIRDTFIILFITVGLLAILECAFRLSGISPAPPVLSEGMQADPVLLWKTIPGSYGQKSSRFVPAISFVHNKSGMRMRHDIEPKKPGTFRVLMLGDSNIWGFGVEQAQTCASVLQQLLDERNENQKSIEVINMGVIGYSSYQGMKQLEQSLALQPDLIVLGYGYNDRRYIASKIRQDSAEYFLHTYRAVCVHQLLFEHSSLCNWASSWNQNGIETTLQESAPRVPVEQYQNNFQTMLTFCQKNNLQVIVLGLRDNPAITQRIELAIQYESEKKWIEAASLYINILSSPNITESSLAPYLFSQFVAKIPADEIETLSLQLQIDDIENVKRNVQNLKLPIDSMMGMTVIRRDEEYLAVLPEICSNYNNVRYIDFRDVMASLSIEEQWQCYFPVDPCHINSKGNALLANYLASIIMKTVHTN